ncbi:gp436 family protein [Maledivibacter halophilus]|uniref:Mu-like prophage protein gp36 n=1 Tax=Maledivibacter halophilus TaxID=36842 RepID=A0A1T5LW57_9FIRM|nr:DUF1320 domain-containing protein [Maledivibacter halophilus]SKC68320.1 Mu-like prophage protein gp36 [Maledivibacter halophilus]SKC71714.1 Mu-like prophage protein gp36 [Maledivibacter halophilus]SKC80182.1 Mu-like prophage protein gp36 [Maledivibacter halophilus]
MGYSSMGEVREMIKDDAVNSIIGDEYIEDEAQREIKISEIINEAIKDADGEIDGYLNKRYSTPLPSPTPKIINKFSKDIAVYNVYSRIGIDEDERENILLIRYKSAVKFLENVAKGLIDIGIQRPEKRAASGFKINSNKRLFSRSSMKGM